jgi:metal-responsive CopG/Arc/MetJ family transcriptional regulator
MAKYVIAKKRGRAATDETPVRAVRLSDALIEKIDAWWAVAGNGYGTRSDAIRELIERGLEAPAPRRPKASK